MIILQIRDMTTIFISRAELLPAGETIEEHAKWQKEEADACQLDKDNTDPRTGGLFKGCFRASHSARPPLRVLRDQEDGVRRCPMCAWELEDGECTECGLFFDDNGEMTWNDSFTGFSDADEASERDMSGEDLDAEIDMEDAEFGYGDNMEGWQDYLGDETSFMMRRFLEHGIPPHYARRRPLTHSEAGSRRSYSQSVSDIYADEMDTVEEEDEDEVDEDSSMNDFIDDTEEGAEPSSSSHASSTPGQTPQPTNSRPRAQGRARRVVESEPSSSVSGAIEEEDEDEEDQGPIRRGQRNRAQTRILNRANGSREPGGTSSSTTTDASAEQDLDEDTEALLASEGWMLQHEGPDDEMEEDDDDDDSDGRRTTVGWDTTAISNDRVRLGGSLTPTTDRPQPNAPIRPPSRTGNPRMMDTSRGLRRRSSVLSTSTVNYEDGEADDDDSDIDRDGDITMAMNSLRSRRSQAQIRPIAGFTQSNPRFTNRGLSQGAPIEPDTDDNSDHSQPGNGRVTPRMRRQEYNPRISWMFADHQRALQEFQRGQLMDIQPRSTTPLVRPRTSNRNRPSPAQAFSPFAPPAPTRLRTPLMDNSSNLVSTARGPMSPPRRAVASPALPNSSNMGNGIRVERVPSVGSSSNASGILTPGTSTGRSTPSSQQLPSSISQAQVDGIIDTVDRPPSRMSRPPSTTGRRNSAGFSPVYAGFPHSNVGLNIQGRIFPSQPLGNPWGAYVQPRGPRSRSSRPTLRDQPSTATLRPASSRANIRDVVNTPQNMRPQASRIDLRHQSSRRRLNNQASTRTLRASDHARPPQSPAANTALPAQTVARPPPRYTADEIGSLARELVNNRMRELQPNINPVRTNPFTSGFRRPSISTQAPTTTPIMMASAPASNNSSETLSSVNASITTQATPPSPNLGRRRSNHNMTVAPHTAPSPNQASSNFPANAYPNNYLRARQNSIGGGTQAHEPPFGANNRGLGPMMVGSLI